MREFFICIVISVMVLAVALGCNELQKNACTNSGGQVITRHLEYKGCIRTD